MACNRRVLRAYMDFAHELMTVETCSLTDIWLLIVTPSTLREDTRDIVANGLGGWTWRLRLLSIVVTTVQTIRIVCQCGLETCTVFRCIRYATLANRGTMFWKWPFIRSRVLPMCEHDSLKMDEPILTRINTSGPRGDVMKLSSLGVRR